jgi:divalent metal cation (Fe/Co/Zn/Cd) transporter
LQSVGHLLSYARVSTTNQDAALQVDALIVAFSIMRDGFVNVRAAVKGLLDARATTFDDAEPHPLLGKVEDYLNGLTWAQDAGARVRDEGQVFHIEAFIVPTSHHTISIEKLEEVHAGLKRLDWTINDAVVVPVHTIPDITRQMSTRPS